MPIVFDRPSQTLKVLRAGRVTISMGLRGIGKMFCNFCCCLEVPEVGSRLKGPSRIADSSSPDVTPHLELLGFSALHLQGQQEE